MNEPPTEAGRNAADIILANLARALFSNLDEAARQALYEELREYERRRRGSA